LENRTNNLSEEQARKIASGLEKIGPALFNDRRYPKLIELLEQLPKKYLDSPKISYLAALVYTENGNVLSSDYYLQLCKRFKKLYTEQEWEALLIQRSKTDFYLGSYSNKELLEKLEELKLVVKSPENILNLEININQFQIIDAFHNLEIDDELYNKTNKIYEGIENSILDIEQKSFQILFQTDNLMGVIFPRLFRSLIDRRLYDIGNLSFIRANQSKLLLLNNSFENVFKKIKEVHEYAERKDNKLLLAHAYDSLGRIPLNLNFCYFALDLTPSDIEDIKSSLETIILYQLKAYKIYKSLSVLPEAYNVINMAYETHRLSTEWINFSLDYIIKLSEIKNEIDSFSNEVFSKKYNSVIDQIIYDKKLMELGDVIVLDAQQIDIISRKMIEILNLPLDRIENIKNEIISIDYFKSNCTNKDLALLTNQSNPALGAEKYKFPSKLAIFNKRTNIILLEGYDVKEMLKKLND
jgi:hypothetical protein